MGGPSLDPNWIASHLLHGWRTFGGFLLEATRRGVRLDETELRNLEDAKRTFDQILAEQRKEQSP